MDKGTCPQCSGPVERQPGKRGPVPVYCSALCKSRAASARRVADGRYAAELAESASRSAVARVANARPCPYCGVPMEHPRRMQCGSDECERRFNGERNMARAREYRDRTGKWPSQRYERKPERLIDRACLNCCKLYRSTRSNDTGCCSQACVFQLRRVGRSQLAIRVPEPRWMGVLPRRPIVLPPLRRRWYAGFCAECGTPFVHDQPQTITCTASCSHRWYRRFAREKRRAVKRSAFVENVYRRKIFERDRWRCQLCRKPVARNEVVPHPKAPVLDHIIPLAKGGTHEPANVQCAHFLCNSLKGDRGSGEQLLLIG